MQQIDFINWAGWIVRWDFVFWWCVAIVSYAGASLAMFLIHAVFLAADIHRARRPLRKIVTPEAFAQQFEAYNQRVSKLRRVSHPWKEYTESLVLEGTDVLDKQGAPPPAIQNTREPGYYLNDSTVIHPTINLRWYGSIPNHLTAMGILGTFVGLAAGITLAQTGLANDDIKEVQEALGFLLSGASLAFFTSVCGIFCSLVFLWTERFTVRRLHGWLGQWVKKLEACLKLVTTESVMLAQLEENRRQTKQLESFSTEIAFSIGAALEERVADKLIPEFQKLIDVIEHAKSHEADATRAMFDSLTSEFKQSLTRGAGTEIEAMSSTLHNLNQTLAASAELLRQANNDMRSTMEAVGSSMGDTLSTSSKAMQQGVEDAMSAVTEGMSHATTSMMEAMSAALIDIRSTVATGTDEMNRGVTATLSMAGSELTHTTEEMRRVFSESSHQLTDSLAASSMEMQTAVRSSLGAVTADLKSSGATVSHDLIQSVNEMRSTLADAAELWRQSLSSASSGIQDDMRTAVQELSESLRNSGTALARDVAGASARSAAQLESVLNSFNNGIGQLSQLQTSCENVVSSSTELVDNCRVLSAAFDEARKGFQETSRPILSSATALEAAATNVRDSVDRISTTNTTMGQAIGTLDASNQKLVDQWQSYEDRFKGIDESLRQTFEQLDDGLQRYMEKVKDFSLELDKNTSKSIQGLQAVTGELQESIETLLEGLTNNRLAS